MTLAQKISEVLAEGGPRKRGILLAMAKNLGYAESQFEKAVKVLKEKRVIREFMRYGGPHYELTDG